METTTRQTERVGFKLDESEHFWAEGYGREGIYGMREDDRRRAEILARRERVEEIERLGRSASLRSLDRDFTRVERMVAEAKLDFPAVAADDVEHDVIVNYIDTLRPTKRNLGVAAEIARVLLGWSAADLARHFGQSR